MENRTSGRRLAKLFRVLVAGGIALGTGCATTKPGEATGKPDDGTASSPPASQPSQPSGVRGW
jgi:hypothetical protein